MLSLPWLHLAALCLALPPSAATRRQCRCRSRCSRPRLAHAAPHSVSLVSLSPTQGSLCALLFPPLSPSPFSLRLRDATSAALLRSDSPPVVRRAPPPISRRCFALKSESNLFLDPLAFPPFPLSLPFAAADCGRHGQARDRGRHHRCAAPSRSFKALCTCRLYFSSSSAAWHTPCRPRAACERRGQRAVRIGRSMRKRQRLWKRGRLKRETERPTQKQCEEVTDTHTHLHTADFPMRLAISMHTREREKEGDRENKSEAEIDGERETNSGRQDKTQPSRPPKRSPLQRCAGPERPRRRLYRAGKRIPAMHAAASQPPDATDGRRKGTR